MNTQQERGIGRRATGSKTASNGLLEGGRTRLLSLWKNEGKIRFPGAVKGGLEAVDTLYDSGN
jgi:hypothetical protein